MASLAPRGHRPRDLVVADQPERSPVAGTSTRSILPCRPKPSRSSGGRRRRPHRPRSSPRAAPGPADERRLAAASRSRNPSISAIMRAREVTAAGVVAAQPGSASARSATSSAARRRHASSVCGRGRGLARRRIAVELLEHARGSPSPARGPRAPDRGPAGAARAGRTSGRSTARIPRGSRRRTAGARRSSSSTAGTLERPREPALQASGGARQTAIELRRAVVGEPQRLARRQRNPDAVLRCGERARQLVDARRVARLER